ncbi:Ca2+-dependent phosphoinositide-specific phospholipase C [Pedobacter cryoconitis]|uniref:Calcium-dependent phosphoinositide phospholipase C n=1 Tax=Pedobacter cryoconitis TaxID=188932 RepID=A0A327S668_9SPHI|nr:Ca2+-dependent phosphoinositide-specific phospholipase C [Pedobacter cryoconitis]RAJ24570.1 calcium-dependent phosphoinositide phospholipase C [Pedobacter cryoconitis]
MIKTVSSALLLFVFPLLIPKDGDNLPINKIQVIGSHNSYKKAIDPHLFGVFRKKDSVSASKIDYEHIGIIQQLDMGLRNLEIDVYADAKGEKYAHPRGLDWAKDQAPYDTAQEMNSSGFKVFHIQDLDFRSDFLTLKGGLAKLRKWSDARYIIRTRADSDTQEARRNDRSNFGAACASGAQIITTDYYLKSTHFKSDYVVSFEGGQYFRVNPFFK